MDFNLFNPKVTGEEVFSALPSGFGLWRLLDWSQGVQSLAQFLFHSDNGGSECLEPKGCPKKIWSMFFEAGVKNQNFKLDPIALKFCMGL